MCGTRLRVDAFVDEHALRRVLSAVKAVVISAGARHQGVSRLPAGQHALGFDGLAAQRLAACCLPTRSPATCFCSGPSGPTT